MSDDGMNLSPEEAQALALLLAYRKVGEVEHWLEWEDLPTLTESGFQRIVEHVRAVALALKARCEAYERCVDIDARLVLERASR